MDLFLPLHCSVHRYSSAASELSANEIRTDGMAGLEPATASCPSWIEVLVGRALVISAPER